MRGIEAPNGELWEVAKAGPGCGAEGGDGVTTADGEGTEATGVDGDPKRYGLRLPEIDDHLTPGGALPVEGAVWANNFPSPKTLAIRIDPLQNSENCV